MKEIHKHRVTQNEIKQLRATFKINYSLMIKLISIYSTEHLLLWKISIFGKNGRKTVVKRKAALDLSCLNFAPAITQNQEVMALKLNS